MNYTEDDKIMPVDWHEVKVFRSGDNALFYNYGSMAGQRVTAGDIYVKQPVVVLALSKPAMIIRPATGRDL